MSSCVAQDAPDDLMATDDREGSGLGRPPLSWHGEDPSMPSGSEVAGSQGFGDMDEEGTGTPSWQRAIMVSPDPPWEMEISQPELDRSSNDDKKSEEKPWDQLLDVNPKSRASSHMPAFEGLQDLTV